MLCWEEGRSEQFVEFLPLPPLVLCELPPRPMSILHPKWSLSHIPAANSPGSDPALLSLVWTVEADTFICPGLSRVSGLPTKGGRVGIHGQPHQTHSLLTAPLRGKERAMWVSGPFLLRIHCCPCWGQAPHPM